MTGVDRRPKRARLHLQPVLALVARVVLGALALAVAIRVRGQTPTGSAYGAETAASG